MSFRRFVMRCVLGRRWPRSKGELTVSGLNHPITIRRDAYGIPMIEAESDADAAFAIGFCQGQDRAFQLETLLRIGRGTLAELVGPGGLTADRMSRRIGFYRTAVAQLSVLDPDVRSALEAYSIGVNAGHTQGLPKKPHEFAILGGEPTPWTAADTLAYLKLVSFSLPSNWDAEIARLRMIRADGIEAVRQVDPVVVPGATGVMSGGVVESLASDLDRFQQVVPPGGGSNNWVIAGSRTASGKPLLANDPHLSPTAPPPWYLVQVRTPNWAAAGATFAGAPPIIIGHNGHLAWGVTAGLTDNTDLFLETVSEDGTSVRLGDGTVQACERRQEVISVKGQADVIEEVLITPRGPIISSLVPDLNEAVSLRAIWLDPLPVRGFFDAQHAKNFESFRQGFTRWPCLPLNVVVADANGEIGWQLAGELPRRVGTSGTVPLEPGNAAFGWEAQALPFEEMPFLRNPACGYYATANEHPHERGHPIPENARQSFLGIDFIDPFRGDTIRDELNKQTTGWDIAACLHLQTSVRCLPWEKMKERVLAIPPKSERLSMALDTLRAWDGRIDAESAAAAVYELFVAELATQVMRSRLPQSWPIALGGSGGGAMANNLFGDRRLDQLLGLIQEQPTGWIDQPWADQLAAALEAAILKLQSEMGPAPNWWAWGHYRTLVVKHQIFGTHKLLAPAFNLGPVPCGGDMNTINQAGVSLLQPNRAVSNLPNLRVVIDTGNWSASRVVLCGGQSGNPLSPHYDDLFPLWQRGEAVPLPWTVEDVLRSAKATLRIQPLN